MHHIFYKFNSSTYKCAKYNFPSLSTMPQMANQPNFHYSLIFHNTSAGRSHLKKKTNSKPDELYHISYHQGWKNGLYMWQSIITFSHFPRRTTCYISIEVESWPRTNTQTTVYVVIWLFMFVTIARVGTWTRAHASTCNGLCSLHLESFSWPTIFYAEWSDYSELWKGTYCPSWVTVLCM